MKIVVSDTGPLLHLREAECLDLLPELGQIVIPPAVRAEIQALDPSWLEEPPKWVAVRDLTPESSARSRAWQSARVLDRGEAEAFELVRQVEADWLLTDDAAARILAQEAGFEVHGSLGVVLWAAATGRYSFEAATRVLGALFDSSLWISERVRASAEAALGEIFAG